MKHGLRLHHWNEYNIWAGRFDSYFQPLLGAFFKPPALRVVMTLPYAVAVKSAGYFSFRSSSNSETTSKKCCDLTNWASAVSLSSAAIKS